VRLRIGTRRSKLALAQAREVAERLSAFGVTTELVPMATSGDEGRGGEDAPGGLKGLFVAEIVRALQAGRVDLAVHSAKDLPSEDPVGVIVAAVPERADPFDVLVTRAPGPLGPGAVIGTSSLRRQAQLMRARPEIRVAPIRGNVETRLAKLDRGDVDGLVLAAAGLVRLGIAPPCATPMPLEEMVPAPGQGALAVQTRAEGDALEVVRELDHERSRLAFEAERALVARLGGGCSLPLGAYAEEREMGVRLLAVVIRPDGSDLVWSQAEAPTPQEVAGEVAATLLAGGADRILRSASGEDTG
jgi:hydroxymethylbilane synthase